MGKTSRCLRCSYPRPQLLANQPSGLLAARDRSSDGTLGIEDGSCVWWDAYLELES